MLGNVSFGNKRNFEQFKNQIPISILPLFEEMREFCFSLGDSIIEDVRMHRIVFCNSCILHEMKNSPNVTFRLQILAVRLAVAEKIIVKRSRSKHNILGMGEPRGTLRLNPVI